MKQLVVLPNQQTKLYYGLNLLNQAVERSFRNPLELNENLKIVEIAEGCLFEENIPFLLSGTRQTIMKNFLDSQPDEKAAYRWFENNLKTLFGAGYSIVKRKNDAKHKPDFWLSKDDEYIPVEVKLHAFNEKALKQLVRYMNFYKCESGVAVGKTLDCDLPKNIKFISFETKDLIGGYAND
ncbi:hypothetical protein A0U40_13495 [[Bacillus] sp. KCTC 13219]|nr:hypothetical protein A0U40_13495 [[Bacillus] sp. KCTC 13219]